MQKLLSVVDNAFVEDDPEKPKNTRAVIIVKDGKIIAEKYGEVMICILSILDGQ